MRAASQLLFTSETTPAFFSLHCDIQFSRGKPACAFNPSSLSAREQPEREAHRDPHPALSQLTVFCLRHHFRSEMISVKFAVHYFLPQSSFYLRCLDFCLDCKLTHSEQVEYLIGRGMQQCEQDWTKLIQCLFQQHQNVHPYGALQRALCANSCCFRESFLS